MIDWLHILQPIHETKNATRLFHGRGRDDEYSPLVIDWFAPVLVVRFYQETSIERDVIDSIMANINVPVVVQRRWLREGAWQWIGADPIDKLTVEHSGMSMQLTLGANQNVGLFHDMAPIHEWVRAHAEGKRVANLFAYTCAFSVAALQGGAEACINVDMAAGALSTGRINHQLNDVVAGSKFLKLDILKSFGRLNREGPYDLVIADPPSFQRGSFEAERHYQKLLRRVPELLTDNGEALFCLNDPGVSEAEFRDWVGASGLWHVVERLEAARTFADSSGETALKVLRCRPS